MPLPRPDNMAALESRINRDAGGCWLWTGSLTSGGYGQVQIVGKTIRVHRLVYELLVGPVPEGLVLDHVKARGCTTRACVNPEHLEPVTHRTNTLRGVSPIAENAAKVACPEGHPYDLLDGGRRRCLTCRRAVRRASYHRLKEAA